MKFFAFFEILRSVFLSAVTGFIFGCIYMASERIFLAVRKIIYLVPNVISCYKDFSYGTVYKKIKKQNIVKFTPVTQNIYEAILFLLFGIYTVLLTYIVLDGVFRIYILITVILFFFVAKKSIGNIFAKLFDKVFANLYFIFFLAFTVFIFPIYKFINVIVKFSKRVLMPLQIFYLKWRSEKLIIKKKMEINKILVK